MKIKTKIALILALVITLGCSLNAFAEQNVEIFASDTVAGEVTLLRSSKVSPGAKVEVLIRTPENQNYSDYAIADNDGVAKLKLSDYYTKTAGIYEVMGKVAGEEYGSTRTFEVLPSFVSTGLSEVYPEEQVARVFENASLTVKLLDDYKNPVSGHLVKLISSGFSEISSVSKLTDSNGEITFYVNSEDPGTFTYTFYDATEDKIIDSRAKIVVFDSSEYLFSNKIDYNYAAIGNSSGPVDSLKFDDYAGKIYPNESINITVKAIDSREESVTGYLGKVRFSALGDNANYVKLPEDYTFAVQDQGTHTFSLGFTFQQVGTYKIRVSDVSNTNVYGEYTFTVEPKSQADVNVSDNSIKVENPVSGTYSSNVIVVSGKTAPGAKLKIFDNDIEIGSAVADISGKFSFTTSTLEDGTHKIFVASVNDVGTIIERGDILNVVIDTAAPTISQVKIEPGSEVTPETIVKVTVLVEEDLSKLTLEFAGNVYDLTEVETNKYVAQLKAPVEFGDYSLDFVLTDQLGNESKVEDKAVIKVKAGSLTEKKVPEDVSGLSGIPGNNRVTLTWSPVKSLEAEVNHYRVFYGISPTELTEAVDTFTDSNTWYIPGLQNGVTYYFAVVAISDNSVMSEHLSNIVTAVPSPTITDMVPLDITNGTGGSDDLKHLKGDVSESGPELTWLLIISLIAGVFYSEISKRRNPIRINLDEIHKTSEYIKDKVSSIF